MTTGMRTILRAANAVTLSAKRRVTVNMILFITEADLHASK
jgi:hypothetical protein